MLDKEKRILPTSYGFPVRFLGSAGSVQIDDKKRVVIAMGIWLRGFKPFNDCIPYWVRGSKSTKTIIS